MKKFVRQLLTNYFGILTGTLNVCYFVSDEFIHELFSNNLENNHTLFERHLFYWMEIYYAKPMIYINTPAMIVSILPITILEMILNFSNSTYIETQLIFLLFFIYIQWLFIGSASKQIIQKLNGQIGIASDRK